MTKNDPENPIFGFSCSIVLHLILLFFILFHSPAQHLIVGEQTISFDILPISEISNVPIHEKKQAEINSESSEAKEIINKVDTNPPEYPAPEEILVPKTAPLKIESVESKPTNIEADNSQSERQVKQEGMSQIVQETKIEPEIQELKTKPELQDPPIQHLQPPKPDNAVTKTPTKKQKIPSNSELDSLLKNFEKSSEGNNNKSKIHSQKLVESNKTQESKGKYNSNIELSLDEASVIRQRIIEKWNLPRSDKASVGQIQILVFIALHRDGSVLQVRLQEKICGNAAASICQAVADSALRAVRHASPFINLPQERYNVWREFTFIFLPSKMFR